MAAEALLGTPVRAYASGRARARMSPAARWTIGIVAGIWVTALVLLHVILVPGGLVVLVLYEVIRPRRGVAVTATTVVEMSLRVLNAMPKSSIAVVDPVTFATRAVQERGKVALPFPNETVTIRERDFAALQEAAASMGTPTLPPPPGGRH